MPSIYAKKRKEAPASPAAPPPAAESRILPGFHREDVLHCLFCQSEEGLTLGAYQREVPLWERRLRGDGVLHARVYVARCKRHLRAPFEACATCKGLGWWYGPEMRKICLSCHPRETRD